MATNSVIEWTESTWNCVTGCTPYSPGCLHCYAQRMARRLQAMGQEKYQNGFEVTCHEHVLEDPLHWGNPSLIFVNSMSDTFHRDVPDAFIQKIFRAMHEADWHTYQLLTKRSERLLKLSPKLPWADHIWAGVTVESQDFVNRIDHLRATGAKNKFLSLEPLLSDMPNLTLEGIDWVIVGGESGPGARPMEPEWVRGVRDQCLASGVPFFFKQWGGVRKKANGCLLDGREWKQTPMSMTSV